MEQYRKGNAMALWEVNREQDGGSICFEFNEFYCIGDSAINQKGKENAQDIISKSFGFELKIIFLFLIILEN